MSEQNAALYCAIPNQVTTHPFGAAGHRGRDSVAQVDTPAYSAGTGRVVSVDHRDPIYGFETITAYPTAAGIVRVLLGHLCEINVEVGQEVSLGTMQGRTGGKPGRPGAGISQGPHLHESTWVNGILVDPEGVLNDRDTIPTSTGGIVEMIGYNYDVKGPSFGKKALWSPDLTVYYPDPDEISAFEQSGGKWVNLSQAMWERILGRCRPRLAPDPVPGGPFKFEGTGTPV